MAGKPARQFLGDKYRDARRPWHLQPSAAFNIVETRDENTGRPASTAFDVVTDLVRGAWAIHQATPKPMNAVTIPALVVSGDLVTVSYGPDGRQIVKATDFERVTWAGAVLPGPSGYERAAPVTLDVLTRNALDNWVPDATASMREIFEALERRGRATG